MKFLYALAVSGSLLIIMKSTTLVCMYVVCMLSLVLIPLHDECFALSKSVYPRGQPATHLSNLELCSELQGMSMMNGARCA